MKKIVFGITSLNQGGAERVLVDLVNKLYTKYDITIFTLYGNNDFEKQLNKNIHLVTVYKTKREQINKFTRLNISFDLITKQGKKIYDEYLKDKYDIEIAFLEGPMTWIMSNGSNTKKIAWVHNDISQVFGSGKRSKYKQNINLKAYDNYDQIVFVSKDNLDKFKSYFPNNKINKKVIYNYIDIERVKMLANEKSTSEIKSDLPSFLQVSRLVEQKSIDRLINVHKKLIDDGILHRIYIVGEGSLKEKLQNQINDLGVNDTFKLLGGKNNPYVYMKSADYFMLTSKYEGFGMVLLEAEALSKYVMITDTAAREAVSNYSYSKIVDNDEKGIYDGIKYIIKNKPQVKGKDYFNNDNILNEIVDVIEGR